MNADRQKRLIDALNQYPLTKYCFEGFIKWLCSKVERSLEEYVLIDAIEKNF